MKPRSSVTALLAITETLLLARRKAARSKQGSVSVVGRRVRATRPAEAELEIRPLLPRDKETI